MFSSLHVEVWFPLHVRLVEIAIVIKFYSPSCLGQKTAKGPWSSSQAATCPPVYHTRWRLHTVPFDAEHQAGKLVNTNFYSFWLVATGNRNRVYRFSSRRLFEMTGQNFLKGSTRTIALSNFFGPMLRLATEDWTQLRLFNLGITSFSYAHVFFGIA